MTMAPSACQDSMSDMGYMLPDKIAKKLIANQTSHSKHPIFNETRLTVLLKAFLKRLPG